MEENQYTQEAQQQTAQQRNQDQPKGLMPGQDREDEIDAMGAILFAIVKNGFNWIKHFFSAK